MSSIVSVSGVPFIGKHNVAVMRQLRERFAPFRRDLDISPGTRSGFDSYLKNENRSIPRPVVLGLRPGIYGFRGEFSSCERALLVFTGKRRYCTRISYFNWYYFREINKAGLSSGLRDILADHFRRVYNKFFSLPTDKLAVHPLLVQAPPFGERKSQFGRSTIVSMVLGSGNEYTIQKWCAKLPLG